ncbi:MAG: hypothetical protein ACI8UO_002015 [Verrucomicrobiales bacterium]
MFAPVAAKLDLAIFEILARVGAAETLVRTIEITDFTVGSIEANRRLILAAGKARDLRIKRDGRVLTDAVDDCLKLLRNEDYTLEAMWALGNSAQAREAQVQTPVEKLAEALEASQPAQQSLHAKRKSDPEIWPLMQVETGAHLAEVLITARKRVRPTAEFDPAVYKVVIDPIWLPRMLDRLDDRTLSKDDQLHERILGATVRASESAGLRDMLETLENPDRFSPIAIERACYHLRFFRRGFIDSTDGILRIKRSPGSISFYLEDEITDEQVASNLPFAYEPRFAQALIPLVGNEDYRLEESAGETLATLGIGGAPALPKMIARMEELYKGRVIVGDDKMYGRERRYETYLKSTVQILRYIQFRQGLINSLFEPSEIDQMALQLAEQLNPENSEHWQDLATALGCLGGSAHIAVDYLNRLSEPEDPETKAAIATAVETISEEHRLIAAAMPEPQIDLTNVRLKIGAKKIVQDRERTSYVGVNSRKSFERRWIYEVEIENQSQQLLENLEVAYRVYRSTGEYVEEFRVIPKIEIFDSGSFKTHTGERRIRVRTVTRRTEVGNLIISHDPEYNSYIKGGTLAGIWMRCCVNGKQIAEYRHLPGSLKGEIWEGGCAESTAR